MIYFPDVNPSELLRPSAANFTMAAGDFLEHLNLMTALILRISTHSPLYFPLAHQPLSQQEHPGLESLQQNNNLSNNTSECHQ
ncbi:hypothetical protein J6590_024847 [Homalodisca vitripennis]|nr:hypothetical protein J6590_024847 [Homalodisca vitripennis]